MCIKDKSKVGAKIKKHVVAGKIVDGFFTGHFNEDKKSRKESTKCYMALEELRDLLTLFCMPTVAA